MQQPKIQNLGWAAFDRMYRGEVGNESEGNVDPFPSLSDLSSALAKKSLTSHQFKPTKSFSSVIRPHLDVPLLESSFLKGSGKKDLHNEHIDHHTTAEANRASSVKILIDVHSWADQQLIVDVLSAVNYDVNQASVLLKAMVSTDAQIEEVSLSNPIPSTSKESCLAKNGSIQKDSSVINKPAASAHEVLISTKLFSIPAEPDLEDDESYLSHRKDAMKMTSAASRHSRAASNAFLRGDHTAAQQLSMKARGEWNEAKKMNSKAAEEIFRINNCKKDLWNVDLHGLHASEAVLALKLHLYKIESEMMNCTASDRLAKREATVAQFSQSEPIKGRELDSNARKALPQQRQTTLQVITGAGKHSRGQASLPSAIRGFLIENGYRFDELRPGVFSVHPKFRHRRWIDTSDYDTILHAH